MIKIHPETKQKGKIAMNLFFILMAGSILGAFILDGAKTYIVDLKAIRFPSKTVEIKYPAVPQWFKDCGLYNYLVEQCKECDVPLLLAEKVIEVESQFNVWAKHINEGGESYDSGLFQINSLMQKNLVIWFGKAGREYNIEGNSWDNIYFGVRVLMANYKKLGTWEKAVQAYNCGERRVINDQIPESTKKYAERIMPTPYWWLFPDGTEIKYY